MNHATGATDGVTVSELTRLVPELIAIAGRASEAILAVYDGTTGWDVSGKDDGSPVTAADMAAHHVIVDSLSRLTPDIPILSEESASIPLVERSQWSRFWLVDPLDGTKEFLKRNGEFTVNIALVEGHRPILGVVVAPVTGVVYWGGVGIGAGTTTLGHPDVSEPIAVASSAASPPRVVGSRSHAGPEMEAFLTRLGEHQLVSVGSSLKACLVAEGAADLYPRFGLTSEWDTAAAQAVVEAAGGKLVDLSGAPLRCNTGESLLNPEFMVFGPTDVDWFSYLPPASP